jgi:pSer/pThr/pTyr-binding forkhead associated (FHA) protein
MSLCELLLAVPPGFALPEDKVITISVIAGPSKGLTRRLVKPHVSIGRSGGGADIEIDDPQLSDMHCAVGVKEHIIRLCDLDSHGGTYVEDQSVSVASLEHLSEFRVGSSLLLVTVLPARAVSLGEEVNEFAEGAEE